MPPSQSKTEGEDLPAEMIHMKKKDTSSCTKRMNYETEENDHLNKYEKSSTIVTHYDTTNTGNPVCPTETKRNPGWTQPAHQAGPALLLVAFATTKFAIVLPYIMAPESASLTYVRAGYQYDSLETRFDNTIWTWGTDYWLASFMTILAIRCVFASSRNSSSSSSSSSPLWRLYENLLSPKSRDLRLRSSLLLFCYAVSTLAGAYAHKTFTDVPQSLNTFVFRLVWTICVGNVTMAGGYLGTIASEICRRFHHESKLAHEKDRFVISGFRLPVVPDWIWSFYGIYISSVCAAGGISYKRPACDIFIAGTTQFVPTGYMLASFLLIHWDDRRDGVYRPYRIMCYAGFLLNVPLLPLYPLLVCYTGWSLASINLFLHTWLTVSWGLQGIGLHHLCEALNSS